MHIDLSDKKVLVTGASRGIGHAIAEAMLDAGADACIHYFQGGDSAADLAARFPNRAVAYGADLSVAKQADDLFTHAVEALGGLDVLVCNAGIALPIRFPERREIWEEAWERTMSVNLKAPAWLSRLAVEHFRQHGGGRIITISSRAAFRGDTAEYMAYAASKAGLVGHTRSIARAFGKDGVKAFLIAPGFVRTRMAEEAVERYGEDFVLQGVALDRLTEPRDVAPLAVMLASGLADHATGTTIDINAASYVH